jgi:UDP-N-acetylmuramoylalanine--D-glutamate ligase
MGLGLHGGGAAAARFCARHGAEVTVTDLQGESQLAPSLEALSDLPIRYVLGRHEEADFREADMVIKNPAVPRSVPYLAMARRVETDLSLFLSGLRDPEAGSLRIPIIAVTGTKGKSTTSAAIHHGLGRLGFASYLGGNITISPLSFVDELVEMPEPSRSPMDAGRASNAAKAYPGLARPVVVLEISSFQLGDLLLTRHPEFLTPQVAVITNIFEDHQDYYGSMEAYVADKRIIYRYQSSEHTLIYHADDAYGPGFATETISRALAVSRHPLPQGRPGAYLVHEGESPNGGLSAGTIDTGAPRTPEPLLPRDNAGRGEHMQMNLLTAALAIHAFGIPAAEAGNSVADFQGIAHRLEDLGSDGAVRFVNDSAATIPDATAQAVDAFDEPTFLIAGGSDKTGSFETFPSISARVAGTYLLAGGGSDRILQALPEDAQVDGPFNTLQEAFDRAYAAAREAARQHGSAVVLLSPGCASFGMFRNEFDRGRQFAELVRKVLR